MSQKKFIKEANSVIEEITFTKRRVLDINDVDNKIATLKKNLDEMPAVKTAPDQETLDYWNKHASARRKNVEVAIAEVEADKKEIDKL